jgi:hypothetical protein
MDYDFDKWAKKTQYITIDSSFINGSPSDFQVSFGQNSNVFIQEMKNIIGIKLVDFFVSGIDGTDNMKFIDILCPTVPMCAQTLDERNGRIFARIATERDFKDDTDKHGKLTPVKTVFFNPISIQHLKFQLYSSHSDGSYIPFASGPSFFMILEVTSLDFIKPHFDTNIRVTRAIEKLTDKVNDLILLVPKDPERHKKFPAWALFVIIGLIGLLVYFFIFKKAPLPQVAPRVPMRPI